MLFVYISLSMATVGVGASIFKNCESLLLSAPKVVLSIDFHIIALIFITIVLTDTVEYVIPSHGESSPQEMQNL